MQSVGTRLREARVKKGYTLEDVHARTRILLKNLAAIEADDLSKISSPFTYRSFVRQIAETLSLDAEAFAADALAASSSMPEPLIPGQGDMKIVRNLPIQPRVKSNFSWSHPAVLFCAVAGVAAGGFFLTRYGNLNARQYTARVSDVVSTQMKAFAPEKAAPTRELPKAELPKAELVKPPSANIPVAEPAPAATANPVMEELAPQPENRPSQQPSLAPISTRSQEPKNVAEAAESYSLPDTASDGIHIELSATEPTWLSIESDGKATYSGTLEIAETKVLDGHDMAQIKVANAGGVSITFNGRLLGTLGRHGQARTFVFTKTGYEIIQQPTGVDLTRLSPSGE
jgi:cytoskeletal protein RodZ